VQFIQSHLKVSAKEKSFVISVSFEAGSPQTAALVANAVMWTYLKGVDNAKADRIASSDKLTSEEIAKYRNQIDEAERKVTAYVESHVLPEVQSSQTTAVQLSEDEKQLLEAREDYAKKKAAFETVSRNSVQGSMEALDSKTISTIRELQTRTQAQMDVLGPNDPRRNGLQLQLNSLAGQLQRERESLYKALARDVQIAQARVTSLETSVAKERETAQTTNVAGTSLKQLNSDLDAKRQLFVSFVTQAGQARISAINAPTAHQLFRALPPDLPAHSFGGLSVILGLMLGGMGSGAFVVLRSMLRTKVDTAEEMAVATGLPVVGSLPKLHRTFLQKVPVYAAPSMAETFRTMWLAMRPQDGKGVPILITSSEIGEGKTTIAMALAQRFADDDFRVLLIDADLRHPRLSSLMGRGSLCLQHVLNDGVTLEKAVVHSENVANLDFLLTLTSENPAKLLRSRQFEGLLQLAMERYDFVILDSPPVLHVADPIILGRLCRYILFVVQSGRMSEADLTDTLRRFPEDDQPKIFTILNRVPRKEMKKSDYYSGYVTA
jgi:capsular exopolysaccharide synthesis family protein